MATKSQTLIDCLTGGLSYDRSWAVYAEKINGEWKAESPARFGQKIFENGGLLDDCELFGDNETLVDAREEYTEGDDDFFEEWAYACIQEMNEVESDA